MWKTLLVVAKIVDLIQSGEVDEDRKILYTCGNKEVQLYVRQEVTKRYPNFQSLETKSFSPIYNDKFDVASIFGSFIQEYSYIFMDEAEDWDPVVFNKISTGELKHFSKSGVFWILFDHIQSSSLNAGFVIGNFEENLPSPDNKFVTSSTMKRRGRPDCEHRNKNGLEVEDKHETVFEKDGEYHFWEEVVKYILPIKECDCENKDIDEMIPMTTLDKIFRSSLNINGIFKTPLISMFDPKMKMGHEILGPEPQIICFPTEHREDLQNGFQKSRIIEEICSTIINLTGASGIHSGDIAVTFDGFDYQNIFGDRELAEIVEEINEQVLAKYEFNDNSRKRVPQATTQPVESILKTHKKATDCDCKYFFGHYSKLKGLTVKVVILMTVQGNNGDSYNLAGFNRLACYLALSRSSCACILFNIIIKDMSMKQYQTEKMNFDKEKLQDGGFDRRTNYTYCGDTWDNSRDYPEVLYIQPDGTSDSAASVTFPQHDTLGNVTIVSTTKRFLRKELNFIAGNNNNIRSLPLDFSYAVEGRSPPKDQQISISFGECSSLVMGDKQEEIELMSGKLDPKATVTWNEDMFSNESGETSWG